MSEDTRPFLPEPDPPSPPKKSHATRTLLLWVLLVVMFLAIWQSLSPGPSAEPQASAPRPPPCADTGSPWTSTATSIIPIVFLLSMFFLFLRRLQGNAGFNLSQEPGFYALAERRFSDAAGVFSGLAARLSKKPLVQAVALYNLGYTQILSGQFDDAIRTLARVEKVFGAARASGIRVHAALALVFVNGLVGDFDTAERWANDGRARLAKTPDDRLLHASFLCLGETIVRLRRGQTADALASLEKNWLQLRDKLSSNQMRVAEILRAFAEAKGGVREYNTVGERLIRVEPVLGNEFAFLGARWPEMHEFLVAHRVVTAAPVESANPG